MWSGDPRRHGVPPTTAQVQSRLGRCNESSRDTLLPWSAAYLMYHCTMLTLTGDFGDLVLDPTLANAHTRFALANGFCGNLAEAILILSPERPIFFVTYELEDVEALQAVSDSDDPEAFHSHVTHVLVASSKGMLLDSYGVSSAETLEKFYGGRLLEGTRAMLHKHYVTDSFTQDCDAYKVLAQSAFELEALGMEFNRNGG